MATLALILLPVLVKSDCGTWTVSGQTLDLHCLSGSSIDAQDNEEPPHDYLWSFCENGIRCKDDAVMVAQKSRTDNACYVLGRWDKSIAPTYSDLEGGTWTFRYDNGAEDCGNPARTWAPTFVCAPGVVAQYETVSEIPGSCFYELTVRTQYACVGQSYACPNVTDVCEWYTEDGKNNLNLTALRNKTLSRVDNQNDALMYLLTPCRNHVKCGTEHVMADIVNMNTLECETYLAKWDGGKVAPSYNSKLKQWKFVYNNGETCDGEENISEIIWNCDETIKDNAEIVRVKDNGACNYQIYVNSSLVCD